MSVRPLRDERGLAMLVAVLAMSLMLALGVALLMTATTETLISASFRHSHEALYAADAIAARALDELAAAPDWSAVLDGTARSAFVDGPPWGFRTLADGSTIDLEQIVNLANCQKPTPCTVGDMNQSTAERPWASNNPRWGLYAHGYLRDLAGRTAESNIYVLLLAADDAAETDGDPLADGANPGNPGTGVLLIRAEAFGPHGAHRAVELTVPRAIVAVTEGAPDTGEMPAAETQMDVRVISWREIR